MLNARGAGATHCLTTAPTHCRPCHPPVQFERQFENLDVQSEFVEQAMQNQAVLSTPEDDVNMLVQQARCCCCVVHGLLL